MQASFVVASLSILHWPISRIPYILRILRKRAPTPNSLDLSTAMNWENTTITEHTRSGNSHMRKTYRIRHPIAISNRKFGAVRQGLLAVCLLKCFPPVTTSTPYTDCTFLLLSRAKVRLAYRERLANCRAWLLCLHQHTEDMACLSEKSDSPAYVICDIIPCEMQIKMGWTG